MHANEAREISERNIAGNLKKVYAAIKAAAESEGRRVTLSSLVYGKHPDDIVRELVAKGYTAAHHSDQRDGDYIDIRW